MKKHIVEDEEGRRHIVEAPDDWTPEQVMAQASSVIPQKSDVQKRVDEMPWQVRALTGIGEAGLQAVTGLGASVAGGFAGIGDLALSSIGKGSGAPGDTVRKVQELGTYQPRSAQGQRAADLLSIPMDIYTKGVRAVGDSVRGGDAGGGRDLLGTTVDVAGESLPALLGGVQALRSFRNSTPAPLTQKQQTLANAQKEGYTVPPSLMGERSWLEGIGGKARTAQLHSAKNEAVTTKIATRELGIPEGTPLTPEVLSDFKKGAYDIGYVPLKKNPAPLVADEKYLNEVVSLPARSDEIRGSFPDAPIAGSKAVEQLAVGQLQQQMTYGAAVERIRQLRFEADRNFKAFNDPEKMALAHAQRNAAKSLESLIERNLEVTGDSALLKNFRDARVAIAKANTVEDALNPATGVVSARDLAKSKAPMTGGLKTASDFARAFPRAVQKAESYGGTPPISPLDVSMGTLAGLGTSAATGNMSGLLAGGVPLLRPLAAPVTRAPFVQNGLARNPRQIPYEFAVLPALDPEQRRLP